MAYIKTALSKNQKITLFFSVPGYNFIAIFYTETKKPVSFWLLLDCLQDSSDPDLRPLQERGFKFRVLRVVRHEPQLNPSESALTNVYLPAACQGLLG